MYFFVLKKCDKTKIYFKKLSNNLKTVKLRNSPNNSNK